MRRLRALLRRPRRREPDDVEIPDPLAEEFEQLEAEVARREQDERWRNGPPEVRKRIFDRYRANRYGRSW